MTASVPEINQFVASRAGHGGVSGARAIVIGAGTSGLICAAAAARHFREVTVLDRDRLPPDATWRRGAPHVRHLHILLDAGRNIYERLLPGITNDLVGHGARQIDVASDLLWHYCGDRIPRIASGLRIFSQSGELLEWTLRRKVNEMPNVRFQDRTGVTGLVTQGSQVRGVRLDTGEAAAADLVIDASGRNSHSPAWLEQAGFGRVRITELPVDVGYSTCRLTGNLDAPPQRWRAVLVHPKRPDRRYAALLPIEEGHWLAMLAGWHGDHPPSDYAGFRDWSRTLAVPDLNHFVRSNEIVGPIHQWRFAANLRRHYECLRGMPDGLIVVGDAVASINPLFAQGMAHGALGAAALDQALTLQRGAIGAKTVAGLSRRFQKSYARLTDQCWLYATAGDLSSAHELNGRYSLTRVIGWYASKFVEFARRDEIAAGQLLETWHMLQPPSSLLHPRLLLRMLARGWRPARMPCGPGVSSE